MPDPDNRATPAPPPPPGTAKLMNKKAVTLQIMQEAEKLLRAGGAIHDYDGPLADFRKRLDEILTPVSEG